MEADNHTTDNFDIQKSIKSELFKTFDDFINELDLLDFVDTSRLDKLKTFRQSLEDKENYDKSVKDIYDTLKVYNSEIMCIVMSKKKLKTRDFAFLDKLVLFDNTINFDCFSKENKSTKQSIVKYLYSIYMSCMFLQNIGGEESNDLSTFLKGIENLHLDTNMPVTTQNTHQSRQRTNRRPLPRNNQQSIDNIFQNILGNTDLMKIANEIGSDLQNEDFDPLTLVSSMMSGKPNPQLNKLVQNVSSKIEQKINSGELDKSKLESEATTVMKSLENTNVLSQFSQMFPETNNKK
jgi:hypothetical protein